MRLSDIQVEQQDPQVTALMGIEVMGMAPWIKNHDFIEVILRKFDGDIAFGQLQEMNRLFKPYKMIIHLEPLGGAFESGNIFMLFEKHAVLVPFRQFSDYVQRMDDMPETCLD